ncbi:hypothetical protein ASPZODRAFT_1497803 [Penicilliopsis zonata CBS 506.65]|uniref:Disintegrin and metalloproteinase domain-containing protein B n=1 Tax=Penicilliopsis zonata CBS 506.65 TaxID=1073090 RepID=A0A1L9SQF0_9EURO|nr:hypothetical protein ASPZODRAFT_1497803 [Penicilliopsis zonata CBS 506.65]OJJ49469.1 hypothetical protein ASPZODRAFT_1497803 [Penicilliopsis zonata CBS 506.65]
MKFFRALISTFFVAASLLVATAQARSKAPNAIRYVSVLDNVLVHTPSHLVNHLSQFDITFDLHGGSQRIKLSLEPNHDILAEDALVQYLDVDGNVRHAEPIDRSAHRVFKGNAWVKSDAGRWEPVGWARVYMKKDGQYPLFEGAFSVLGDHHHIELQSTYLEKKRDEDVDIPRREGDYMLVYRNSDMIRYIHSELKRSLVDSASCSADQLGFNSDPRQLLFQQDQLSSAAWGATSLNSLFGLSRRQSDTGGVSGNTGGVNLKSTIGSTAGCPNNKMVALIGVATDCGFTSSFNSTESAREWVINVVNTASSLYEKSFNISIGLRNLTISDASCPSTASSSAPWNLPCSSSNITQRLDLFSKWRGSNNDSNAYWTLMSECSTDSEVGLSWLGQLCNTGVESEGSDYVSGTNVVVRISAGWQVFAHESGHTFGAVHDCDSTTCSEGLESTSQCCPLSTDTCNADGKYIMNPSASADATLFSPCTIGNICSALGRNSVKSTCLSDNKGVTTITGSQCGNGIVEAGEECDCGGTEACGDNSCCDGSTCKFKNGAVCDDSNDICCTDCQYAAASTVCRASTGSCDIEEKCTGNSSSCPADAYEPDGTSCGNSTGLKCASGSCTSRDLQCRTVVGALLNSNDTYACDSTSCTLTCASSVLGSNACATLNQNFLDGTPCGGGGKCENGQCKGSTVGKEIKSWVDDLHSLVCNQQMSTTPQRHPCQQASATASHVFLPFLERSHAPVDVSYGGIPWCELRGASASVFWYKPLARRASSLATIRVVLEMRFFLFFFFGTLMIDDPCT